MKIITFKYNRPESAIQKSTLLADEDYAGKNLYLLSPATGQTHIHQKPEPVRDNRQQYCISGTWQ